MTKPSSILPMVAALAAGCSGAGAGRASDNPTLIAVDPVQFLGDVPCLDSPGAMRRFVATIEDVTEDLGSEEAPIESFVLPSSPPVPCTHPVAFGFVVPGHRYVADVQGYDRLDLEPMVDGSPVMLDRTTGEVVSPRWTTSCGRQYTGTDRPVVARRYATTTVRACEPLLDHDPTDQAPAITVSIHHALGRLSCGTEPGTVATFDAVLEGQNRAVRATACGSAATFDDLEADMPYTFTVTAFDAGTGEPRWNTSCFAVARTAATIPATCDPLLSTGALEVDVPGLLVEAGEACAADGIATVVVTLLGSNPPRVVEQVYPDCLAAARFDDVPAGSHELDIMTSRPDGTAGPSARCEVDVQAGQLTRADCAWL